MAIQRLIHLVLGTIASPPKRDERGLSQSTENVILLVGAVAIAAIVIRIVQTFVENKLVLLGP